MSRSFLAVVALAVVVATSPALSADLIIDDFSAGGNFFQFGSGTNTRITMDGAILGGERSESLTVRNTSNPFFGAMGFDGEFSLAQGNGDEIFGSLLYDNFSDVDLTQGGTNHFFGLQFVGSDADFPLTGVIQLTVRSGANVSSQFVTVPRNSTLPTLTGVAFADFAGIDFTQVDSVELAFDFAGYAGRDFTMDFFGAVTAVPEPATLMLPAALAGCGLLWRRRR